MSRGNLDRYPALVVSAALHVGAVLAALLIGAWLNKPIQVPPVVSVTLMTSADLAAARQAVEAPTPTPAATEEPVPEAAPARPAPEPAPTPEPPRPAPAPAKAVPVPKPAPTPKPSPKPSPKPAPATPTKAAPKPVQQAPAELDLDALGKSLAKTAKASGARQSSAPRGPSRPQTAVKASASTGNSNAISASALNSIGAELQRLWNPNCDVMGGSDVNIQVSFRLGAAGRLLGQPESSVADSSDPIVKAASDRAVRAVNQAQPFDNLPPALYGPRIAVNFNARQACAQR